MYEYNTRVEKVVDGDTIDVFIDLGFNVWHKERLRLSGIDTAEKNTPLGKATAQLLRGALEGKMVRVSISKQEKYGRYLASVFLNSSVSINDQLLQSGIAKCYNGDSKSGLWTEAELNNTSLKVELK